MKIQKILVLGATGKTGRRVVDKLTAKGISIRKGSRNATIPFDWLDTTTWKLALQDIKTVYITFQPDLAVPGAKDIIKEFTSLAVEMDVKKLVLLSGKGEREAELCEEIVKHSGVNWTIVRASWFNQNFSEGFFVESIIAGHIRLPKTDALVPYVDADDIADVVVKTLLEIDHHGKTYELTGPETLTFQQAIAVITSLTAREIIFSSITMEEYKAMLREFAVPEDYIWLIEYLFTEVLTPENSIVTNDIEKVLGRKPKTFTEYVKNTAETGIWNPIEKAIRENEFLLK